MARVGIIGTGWGARVQVPLFREAGLDVVALAGHDPDRTRRIASELNVADAVSWQAIVASDVDLISIATPPSEHLELASAALHAGKHVLTEKPTAMNANEAQSLLTAARERPDRIALIDHELRFLPAWLEARERMKEIGPLRYAEVRYSSPSRGDRTRGWNWWSDATRGGGIWGAVGSHFVDAIRYFGSEIVAVQAMLHTAIEYRPEGERLREVTSDDIASVHFRLQGGAVAMLSFSAAASGADEPAAFTLHGEEGAIRLIGEEMLLARRSEEFRRVAGADLSKRPGNSPGGAFGTGTLHLGIALRRAIADGDLDALAPAATFEDGLAQQRVLDAARLSNTHGGWEEVVQGDGLRSR